LKEHLDPKPNEISEEHKFAQRVQLEGESISDYVKGLKALTTHCNFVCLECKKPTILVFFIHEF
jgi:hypothetical protein